MTWFSASELAGQPGMPSNARNIKIRASKYAWRARPRNGRGGGLEYHISSLPGVTQAALLHTAAATEPAKPTTETVTDYDRDALWRHYERKPQPQKSRAKAKLAALQAVAALTDNGTPRTAAAKAAAQAQGVAPGTLYRWLEAVEGFDRADWLAALVPGYTGRTTTAECSVEAWDHWKSDYLRPEQPTAQACYERLRRTAAERGWQVPSLRTLQRRLARELTPQAVTLAREGREALKRRFPAQERDRSVFHALEAVNADGHKFDVFVKWPDGEIGRPIMACWQDLYSAKILSYRVDKTENTDSIRLSFGDLVEQWGIPDHAWLDNGRGFASKWMTGGTPTRYRFKVREEEPGGLLTTLGVEVHWTTPYHGQAKPIERAFRDLCDHVARHPAFAGAYTGNHPGAKPENYGSKAVPLADFLKVLAAEIAAHNAREGRRAAVCAGRSFDQVFAESYEASPIRRATTEQRRLWLLAAEGVRADRNSGAVILQVERRNRYWHEALTRHAGQPLIVRFDPQRLHESVHVYTLDNRYIAEAACQHAAGFNDSQAAREHARARKQFLRAGREQLNAERRMTALEVAKLLPGAPEAEAPVPHVVRPYRPPVAARAGADTHQDDDEFEENLTAAVRSIATARNGA